MRTEYQIGKGAKAMITKEIRSASSLFPPNWETEATAGAQEHGMTFTSWKKYSHFCWVYPWQLYHRSESNDTCACMTSYFNKLLGTELRIYKHTCIFFFFFHLFFYHTCWPSYFTAFGRKEIASYGIWKKLISGKIHLARHWMTWLEVGFFLFGFTWALWGQQYY